MSEREPFECLIESKEDVLREFIESSVWRDIELYLSEKIDALTQVIDNTYLSKELYEARGSKRALVEMCGLPEALIEIAKEKKLIEEEQDGYSDRERNTRKPGSRESESSIGGNLGNIGTEFYFEAGEGGNSF